MDVSKLAAAIAEALRKEAVSEWDRDDGDGPVIEIYVSQIAPIAERVLRGEETP